jgi:hypothetical protein
MKLLVNKKSALIAVISSLPFLGVANYYCILALIDTKPINSIFLYATGNAVFLLGSPLTLIYMAILQYTAEYLEPYIGHRLDFLPTLINNVLFIIQWIIWSQLIVLAWRRLRRIKLNKYP